MTELRSDRLTDTWVVIAEGRAGRPRDFKLPKPVLGPVQPAGGKPGPCPFCPGNEALTPPEVFAIRDAAGAAVGAQAGAGAEAGAGASESPPERDRSGWRVRVVPNKYPSFGGSGATAPLGHVHRGMDAVGAHEVVIDGPWHDKPFRARTGQEWADLALALQQRLRTHARDPRMAYALATKNQGPLSGASMAHPHSQVVAMPLVPDRVRREVAGFAAHHRLNGRCLLEDMMAEEEDSKARVVEAGRDFVLWCPWASRFPHEMLLAPRAHLPRFEDAPPEVVSAFGAALGRAFTRLEAVLHGAPFESYHFALHTAPFREKPERYHWHCEVMPSLSFHAGFEKGTGMFMNHLGPERCATALREGTAAKW